MANTKDFGEENVQIYHILAKVSVTTHMASGDMLQCSYYTIIQPLFLLF